LKFGKIDIGSTEAISDYFQKNYPRTSQILGSFRLFNSKEIAALLKILQPGHQVTLHAFRGLHAPGNAYSFPRYIRVERDGELFRVTREKAVKERTPVSIPAQDVAEIYLDTAELGFMFAEMEMNVSRKWPPPDRFQI